MSRIRAIASRLRRAWVSPPRAAVEMGQWFVDHHFTIRDGAS